MLLNYQNCSVLLVKYWFLMRNCAAFRTAEQESFDRRMNVDVFLMFIENKTLEVYGNRSIIGQGQ